MTGRSKPESCAGCQCASHGSDFSRVEGTGSSGVMVVAEASGEHEQRDQLPLRPFAPSGGVFERSLRRMGISREQLSVTNVLRCRPRNNWLEGSPWEHAAIAHCAPNLDEAIAQRRPRAILALGNVALRRLTGEAGEARGVGHLNGYVLPHLGVPKWSAEADLKLRELGMLDPPISPAIPVIPCYHPAFLRRGKAAYQGIFARTIRRALNVAAGTDHAYRWNVNPEDPSHARSLGYQPHPNPAEAMAFASYILDNSGLLLSYDIETAESTSLDEDAREGFTDTRIRLVQFAARGAGAIAIPWEPGFQGAITSLLHSPNTKCGHNVWLFDNKVLRAAGEREGIDLAPQGVIHDTLQMFHHWQPDLAAHLQAAAQFVSFPFPWKHLAGEDRHLAFYGCCDVDATLQLYTFLEAALRREGLWDDANFIEVHGAAA